MYTYIYIYIVVLQGCLTSVRRSFPESLEREQWARGMASKPQHAWQRADLFSAGQAHGIHERKPNVLTTAGSRPE